MRTNPVQRLFIAFKNITQPNLKWRLERVPYKKEMESSRHQYRYDSMINDTRSYLFVFDNKLIFRIPHLFHIYQPVTFSIAITDG